MVGIIVTGHGYFATGLGSALQLITGITENVELVDFEMDYSTEVLKGNINAAIDRLSHCKGILILCDLAGGSPFNNAVMCKVERSEYKIEVIAGTNLSMLIEGASMMAAFEEPAEMVEALTDTGKDYILHYEMTQKEEVDDGI